MARYVVVEGRRVYLPSLWGFGISVRQRIAEWFRARHWKRLGW